MAPEPPQDPAQRAKLQGSIAGAASCGASPRSVHRLQRSVHRVLADNVENRCKRFRAFPPRCLALGLPVHRDASAILVCGSAHIAFPLAGRSGAAAMAFAACRCDAGNSRPARFARLRPRLGRSVLFRRRNLAQCPCRAASSIFIVRNASAREQERILPELNEAAAQWWIVALADKRDGADFLLRFSYAYFLRFRNAWHVVACI
jgi:hypothetical protein